jgi:hypothetical protein
LDLPDGNTDAKDAKHAKITKERQSFFGFLRVLRVPLRSSRPALNSTRIRIRGGAELAPAWRDRT